MDEFTDSALCKAEREQIEARRKTLTAGGPAEPIGQRPWGLALSGGGIRSATYALGVLQSLAKTSDPSRLPLLARFDYLSTVSGGGYIGGFMSALFRRPPPPPTDAGAPATDDAVANARRVYQCLATDPPGRMTRETNEHTPGYPMRWLRENGRYMSPAGAGDLFFAVALQIRNWCAVHYVFGITLLFVVLASFAFRAGTQSLMWIGFPPDAGLPLWARQAEILMQPGTCDGIWWSPWWIFSILMAAIMVLPAGIAYWLTYTADKKAGEPDSPLSPPVMCALAVAAGTGLVAFAASRTGEPHAAQTAGALYFLAAAIVIAVAFYWACRVRAGASVAARRVWLTHKLANCLGITLAIGALALIETVSQSLYLSLHQITDSPAPTVSATLAALAAAIPVLKKLAGSVASVKPEGMLARLPIDAVLGVLAGLLIFALAVVWHMLALTLIFQASDPWSADVADQASLIHTAFQGPSLPYALGLLAASLIGTCAAGYFIGFINLSSLSTLYSARLTRAYLGASNRARFEAGSRWRGVTEPHPGDDFGRVAFYQAGHLGPLHLINVTINKTVGSGDNLTQQDRKGLPLAITPLGLSVDGKPALQSGEELSIGQWIGVSGAAFTPGLGRGTSIGKAAVFTLTNIRLGYWWNSGNPRRTLGRMLRTLVRNQRYLVQELHAAFYGTDRHYWYLSDGGHFENTGVYELLRRRCAVVVTCDDGADPNYSYEDLANLMRLARIDFGAEFTLLQPEPAFEAFDTAGLRLGSNAEECLVSKPKELNQDPGTGRQCALAYRIEYAGSADTTLLLVIKPRLVEGAPLDLFEYRSKSTPFPQETTFDQFFDEAQWESYRKLGAWTGDRLFN